jgi:nucleotide-binding universal stress UspA family protein
VANDGSDSAFQALKMAFNLALQSDAELHMLCVAEVSYFPSSIGEVEVERERAHRRLAPLIEQAKRLATLQGLALKCHLVSGHPVPTILNFVRKEGFELLIIGFGSHSTLYNRLIGSTTDWIVELAPCAVLVVK